jgi:triosephosphate isomerase (TIM)
MRTKLIAGNWKMNGNLAANADLVQGIASGWQALWQVQAVLCAPSAYVSQIQTLIAGTKLVLGAQDCSAYALGAYTGDVSAGMFKELGCTYVIVGHSERRQYQQESDSIVAAKAQRALQAGLVPIVCVGESLSEREAGQTQDVVLRQLGAVLQALGADAEKIVVAYEPLWAVGTGKTATPEQAQDVHAAIRVDLVKAVGAAASEVRILYGGSMNAANAAQLLAQADVDGGLVGGAALKSADFLKILEAGAQAVL